MSLEISGIGNYYGGLHIKEEEGKFFWGIENWSGTYFEEIPDYLYAAILKYQEGYKDE